MSETFLAGILLFGILAFLILIKMPISISLMSASLVTILVMGIPIQIAGQRIITALDSTSFLAIPFFILAGSLMGEGGISDRLIHFANSLVGHKRGGLAIVSILSCMFFAAISGSGAATVAAVGAIMIPYMAKSGYGLEFSAAVNASAGGIGIIIPPSIPFISYAILTGSSVGELFTGGITAGLVIGLCLIVAVLIMAKKRAFKALEKASGKERWDAFFHAIPALLMPVIILGGIYSGTFTATESSVVAVVYAILVGFFIYRGLDKEKFFKIFEKSAVSSAQILFLIANATLFGWLLTRFRVADALVSSIISLTTNPLIILILINLILLFMGTFMDTVASIVIVTPILYPIAMKIGLDPVHFGILMCSNLSIGQITPPFGVNLFVASGVVKMDFQKLIKELTPLFFAMVVAALLITFIEPISMGLVKGMR